MNTHPSITDSFVYPGFLLDRATGPAGIKDARSLGLTGSGDMYWQYHGYRISFGYYASPPDICGWLIDQPNP